MKKELKKYLAEIGAKGGKASRRKITPEQQAAMQEARKAARLRKEQNVPDETREPITPNATQSL
jgi:hypothetical protein